MTQYKFLSKRKEMTKVLICPVSGGAFPSQLGLAYNLASLNYKPQISLGSSGGNIAVYTAAAADWQTQGLYRVARDINSKLFLKSWWKPPLTFMPSWLMGFFKGSMYDTSSKPYDFFRDIFNKETVSRYEIWTGTTNLDQSKAQLFCNRTLENSALPVKIQTKLLSSLEPQYISNDLDKITQVCMASACIPTLVEPQVIDKQRYVDGGLLYASPLTLMKSSLINKYLKSENETKIYDVEQKHATGGKGLHMTYLSSFNLDSLKENMTQAYGNMLSVNRTTFSEIVKSLCVQDRYNAVTMIPNSNSIEGPGNLAIMTYIEKHRVNTDNSLVEYYPLDDTVLELTKFTGEDVVDIMDTAHNKFGYRLWWSGNKNAFTKIPKA